MGSGKWGWELGVDVGIWDRGRGAGAGSEVGSWNPTALRVSLVSSRSVLGGTETVGMGTGTGTEPEGPEVSGSGDGSPEWCLVTGVILLGGVGGERPVGAGNTMTPLPA